METYTITVEGYTTFEAEAGAKLAYEIERHGVDISHRCGGHARCTTCRVRFLTPEPPMGQREHDCLEEDGERGNFRLSCQIPIDRDMTVQVLMPVRDQEWDNPGEDLEPGFED